MPKPARVTPLTTDQVQHLEDFLGYGRLDAPVWFVGMEEGGGGPENIRARLHFRPVEDCADAHRKLNLLQYHRAERPVIQRTWGQMARFMLQLQGSEPSADHVRSYQAGQLGRTGGDSMLLELMGVEAAEIVRPGGPGLPPPLHWSRPQVPSVSAFDSAGAFGQRRARSVEFG